MHCRGLDFDDLLSWPVALLEQCSEVRHRLQARYKHILVDEFQDTNAPQYELVRLLAGNKVSTGRSLLYSSAFWQITSSRSCGGESMSAHVAG